MQQWQEKTMPPNSNYRPSQTVVQQREQQQNPSRGRSRHQSYSTSNSSTRDDSKSHSNSNTPRRKGNPQSPQYVQQQHPQSTHVDSLEILKSRSRSHSSSCVNPGGHVDLTTPLATLSTILITTKSYHECAIKSYRVNHKLFRDAKDRTAKGEFCCKIYLFLSV
jgi:hypothetical protein